MLLTLNEHGANDMASDSIVIVINPSKGILYDRTQELIEVVRNARVIVFEINELDLDVI